MKTEKEFPNGFNEWVETYFEIVSTITEKVLDSKERGVVYETESAYGRGGLYDLAKELTDKFESLYEGREWEGDYFDAIDEFLKEEL